MRILNVFIFLAYSHLLNAFTVTVPKDSYIVEHGSNVTMECKFPVGKQLDLVSLVVYWEKEDKQIIQFVHGKEDLKVQHRSYRQRARLLKEQLFQGNAVLQITDVKLQDAGVYCCMISYGGADYKRITLKVNAPYHKIDKRISVDPVTSEHELTCQAEGYPEAAVIWTNSDHQILKGSTTVTNSQREEKLFNVTSTLRINTTASEIFYCTFRRLGPGENHTAKLIIPEPPAVLLPNKRNHFITLGVILLFVVVALVLLCLRKGDISFIVTVSTGEGCEDVIVVTVALRSRATVAKYPAICRTVLHQRTALSKMLVGTPRRHVKMEIEIGVTLPRGKERREPAAQEARKQPRRVRKELSPVTPGRQAPSFLNCEQRTARGYKLPTDEVELTGQAGGILAEVSWPNVSAAANTSHTNPEDLHQVTLVLPLKPQPH
ncbi:LOW QUALITY PROTEIN: programmed cell death 1 ligand 1 [Ctenodactylus gundi]